MSVKYTRIFVLFCFIVVFQDQNSILLILVLFSDFYSSTFCLIFGVTECNKLNFTGPQLTSTGNIIFLSCFFFSFLTSFILLQHVV